MVEMCAQDGNSDFSLNKRKGADSGRLTVIGRGLVSVYKEAKAFESVFEP